jgi:Sec-independent protein secretion pathway component TatC
LSWVERFVVRVLILGLEHFGLHQALMKHLLLLEMKSARWLGVALELPSMWLVFGRFVKVGLVSKRKEAS